MRFHVVARPGYEAGKTNFQVLDTRINWPFGFKLVASCTEEAAAHQIADHFNFVNGGGQQSAWQDEAESWRQTASNLSQGNANLQDQYEQLRKSYDSLNDSYDAMVRDRNEWRERAQEHQPLFMGPVVVLNEDGKPEPVADILKRLTATKADLREVTESREQWRDSFHTVGDKLHTAGDKLIDIRKVLDR